MGNLRKKGITALKFVFSALLVYLVFTKVNIQEVWLIIKMVDPFLLTVSLILFVISKLFAAFRLNLYFHELSLPISHKSNLELYLLGMFYNLFLPGGIGGDAYKGYVIKKTFDVKTKSVVSVLLLDRLSGLCFICVYVCLLFLFLEHPLLMAYQILSLPLLALGLLVFWFINKKYFPSVFSVYWKSLGYSAIVQLTQLMSVWLLILAMGVESNILSYLFVFLVSSIVAVLPLTIGGIGSREVTFYYFSLWLGLDQDISITLSMMFFLISAFTSLWGIIYHFKKPILKNL